MVFAILTYVLLAPWGYAAFAVVSLCTCKYPEERRTALQAAIRWGFRITLLWSHCSRIIRVSVPRPGDVPLPKPCVVVANHPSHLDIVGLLSWIPNSFTVVKPAIYRQPWLKPLIAGSGHVEGANTHPLEAERLIREAEKRLQSGQNMVIFPEGTRTSEGKTMSFNRLAFEIACRAKAPIVAFKLSCFPSYLSKQRPSLLPPRQVPEFEAKLLTTLYPEEFGGNSRRLRDATLALYRSE